METTRNKIWHSLPPVILPSPVLAIATGKGGLWAAGAGGVAWLQSGGNTWETRTAGLPLPSVTALEYVSGWLFAGGIDGIARSQDGGQTWQKADLQEGAVSITALATSPRFAEDATALAATLESGILRTDDGGQTWRSATFGLQNFEINALTWVEGETVIAATTDGLYRSSNGGRAWRSIRDSEGLSIAVLVTQQDGSILAALEEGELLRSTDGGQRWQPAGTMPEDAYCNILWTTSEGSLLLGTAAHGLQRSTDNGAQWQSVLAEAVLSCGTSGKTLYAGTATGISISEDDGRTWQMLPSPPIHDLRQILAFKHNNQDTLFLFGSQTGLVCYQNQAWESIPDLPYPLAGTTVAPGSTLFVASLTGLLRSADLGQTWQTVVPGEAGSLARFTFLEDGSGWAGSADGSILMRSNDSGQSWQPLQSPLGVLPLSALLATPQLVFAASYDTRQYAGHVWHSRDRGDTWERALEAQSLYAPITTHNNPPLITLGGIILIESTPGQWNQVKVGDGSGTVLRVIGTPDNLLAFTTRGILRSVDAGTNWTSDEDDTLPLEDVQDIAMLDNTLYVLLSGGRVWTRLLK